VIFRKNHLFKVKIFFNNFFNQFHLKTFFCKINCVNSLKLEIILFCAVQVAIIDKSLKILPMISSS
jgi:hypothetical protein